jgi:hypothetical protein
MSTVILPPLRVPEDLADRLAAAARLDGGRSKASVQRVALEQYLATRPPGDDSHE